MTLEAQLLLEEKFGGTVDHIIGSCPVCGFLTPVVWGCVCICGNCGHRTSCHD